VRTFRLDGQAEPAGRHRAFPAAAGRAVYRRNELWLHAFEVGLVDPARGCARRYSADELAGLWAVDCRTVRRGIASAAILRAWRLSGRDGDDVDVDDDYDLQISTIIKCSKS
jgi:hypothetical protein